MWKARNERAGYSRRQIPFGTAGFEMQISLKHRFVFFCTPKCASNSVEAMLRPHVDIDLQGSPQVRHTNVRQYQRFLAPYLAEIAPDTTVETVALVREPVSWLYSWYRFRARSELRATKHVNSTSHVSFEEFIAAYLTEPQPAFARVSSQADFLLDDHGRRGVDHLFAYESVGVLVDWFAGRIGVPLSLRTINVSPGRVYKSNILEQIGALQRQVRSRLVRDSRPAQASKRETSPVLPAELDAALASRLRRDFELHAAALGHPASGAA
jgi:hypothetical protein